MINSKKAIFYSTDNRTSVQFFVFQVKQTLDQPTGSYFRWFSQNEIALHESISNGFSSPVLPNHHIVTVHQIKI